MSCLVTGQFDDREHAQRAVATLTVQRIPGEDIYPEAAASSAPERGRKGGKIGPEERERRFAGIETGLVVGVTVGFLAGLGVAVLGGPIAEMIMRGTDTEVPLSLYAPRANWLLAHPLLSAISGALIGLLAGGLIGWITDYALTWIGAGSPGPPREALVTVRCEEDRLGPVCAALFRAGARQLSASERAYF